MLQILQRLEFTSKIMELFQTLVTWLENFYFAKGVTNILQENTFYLVLSYYYYYYYYCYYYYYYYYRYSAFGPVWAETRAQSGDWYSSGTLHPGQVLRGSLPLLSPAFRRSHFRHQVSP